VEYEAALDDLASSHGQVMIVNAREFGDAEMINAAVYAAKHDFVSPGRLDSGYSSKTLRRAVSAMLATGADVVGGGQIAVGLGSAELAASRAMNSRLGVGPRPSRLAAAYGAVDSVQMLLVRREAFERAGGFDASFDGAADWELQHRLRRDGGMVWLDPSLSVRSRPPVHTRDVASRYFHSGCWRRAIIARHPSTRTLRYMIPPALLIALAFVLVGAVIGGLVGPHWLWILTAAPLVYALALALAVGFVGRGLKWGGKVRMWWTCIVIHFSWAAGFLFGRRRKTQAA
jgi:hypothetical protein